MNLAAFVCCALLLAELSADAEQERKKIIVSMGVEGAVSRETKKVRAKAGDSLPHVVLRSTDEREVELPEAAKTSHLVLFFYPGDLEGIRYPELAGCTPEACAFRDNIQGIRELGAEGGIRTRRGECSQQRSRRDSNPRCRI